MFIYPIIAAVRKKEDFIYLKDSLVNTVFLMFGEVTTIEELVCSLKKLNKNIYLHIDLIKGLSHESEAVNFLAEKVKPTGIVTTKGHLIKTIKANKIQAIHHLFLIDTNAFQTGIKNVISSNPDGVEVMPGLMPRVIRELSEKIKAPIYTGGLLRSEREMRECIEAGAKAVITSDPDLWQVKLQ